MSGRMSIRDIIEVFIDVLQHFSDSFHDVTQSTYDLRWHEEGGRWEQCEHYQSEINVALRNDRDLISVKRADESCGLTVPADASREQIHDDLKKHFPKPTAG